MQHVLITNIHGYIVNRERFIDSFYNRNKPLTSMVGMQRVKERELQLFTLKLS